MENLEIRHSSANNSLLSMLSAKGPAARLAAPLTSYQREQLDQLWFNPEARQSPISRCFRVTGYLNAAVIEKAFLELARRHEVLRTTFPLVNGIPQQLIAPTPVFKLPIFNLQTLPEAERLEAAHGIIHDQIKRPYDLTREPLWKAALIRLQNDDQVLLLTVDHLIADDWSMNLMIRDTLSLYHTLATGSRSPLPELPMQFADFAYWQQQTLQGKVREDLVSYWRQQLKGIGPWPEIHLPFENEVPSTRQKVAAAIEPLILPISLTGALKQLSRRGGVTMFMLLLTALVSLLHRYTGQRNIGIPSHVAKRHRHETKDVIGWFASLLVFRFEVFAAMRFSELLQHVRKVVTEAYDHQDLPYSEFDGYCETWLAGITYPCFRFSMTSGVLELPQSNGRQQRALPLDVKPMKLPELEAHGSIVPGIAIDVSETDGALNIVALYEQERYDAADIRRLLENLQHILEAALNFPDRHISELPFRT